MSSDYDDHERSLLISQMSFEKTFGMSTVFIESTLMENGGVPDSANPSTLIREAIHVIGCGYEEKTAWGKEVKIESLSFQDFFWFHLWIEGANSLLLYVLFRLVGFMVQ